MCDRTADIHDVLNPRVVHRPCQCAAYNIAARQTHQLTDPASTKPQCNITTTNQALSSWVALVNRGGAKVSVAA
jgi:hypothetical protein